MFSGHHPGLEGRELPLVLRPAVTYRNNEDKLRGEVTDRAEAWVSEEKGDTEGGVAGGGVEGRDRVGGGGERRGGRWGERWGGGDRRKQVLIKLQRETEPKQLTAVSVVKK